MLNFLRMAKPFSFTPGFSLVWCRAVSEKPFETVPAYTYVSTRLKPGENENGFAYSEGSLYH
jgi:hypothetical protein